MTFTCTPELASAVANAGGLGSLGCAEKPHALIRQQVADLRRQTGRPFNLNFFVYPPPRTDPQVLQRARERLASWYERLGLGAPPAALPEIGPGFGEAELDLVLDLRPPIVSFHFGLPDRRALEALKSAGITLMGSATCVEEARALDAAGMDAVIAQGWEAGGHRGSHRPTAPLDGVGTLALVPQVVDAVEVPVIAAGGIGDGRGIAAAFALDASAVQMGTAFLACPETATGAAWRARLRRATDRDTIVTDAISGRAARAARSRLAEEMGRSREDLPAFLQMYALSDPLLAAAGDDEASFHLYGQAAALGREMPAGELVALLVAETQAAFVRTAGR